MSKCEKCGTEMGEFTCSCDAVRLPEPVGYGPPRTSGHTPGPWAIGRSADVGGWRTEVRGGDFVVLAEVRCGGESGASKGREDVEANARVMAASPALFAAAKAIDALLTAPVDDSKVEARLDTGNVLDVLRDLRAAIAAAEGSAS